MPATLYTPPATLRLAKRFFWKECRRLLGLAVGVVIIAVLTMLFVKTFASSRVNLDGLLAVIAIGGGAVLAVAAAVTLFSVEKEEGTVELLRLLPRNALATGLGKTAAAIAVTAATTIAMLLVAWLLAETAPTSNDLSLLTQQGSLLLAEAFVWGLIASLLCPNPLVAAVLGIAAASASSQLAIQISNPNAYGYRIEAFIEATYARLALVAAAAVVANGLASRWPAPLSLRHGSERTRTVVDREEKKPLLQRLPLGLFGRLIWQTLRQSWAMAIVATLLGAFLTGMCVLMAGGLVENQYGLQFLIGFSALFAPALLGAVVFRADQRRDAYRFLAEHAGRPSMLWLARNTVGLAMLAALLAILLASTWWLASFILPYAIDEWPEGTASATALRTTMAYYDIKRTLLLSASAAFVAYAVGQFCSLTLRSDVLAAMLALIAAVLVAGWAMTVWAWRLPPLAFTLPIGVGALLASLLRVRAWMFDRRGLWRWGAPLAALVAPVALVAWATPGVRLAQVAGKPPWIRQEGKECIPFEQLANKAQEELRRGREVTDAYQRLEADAFTAVLALKDEVLEEKEFEFAALLEPQPTDGLLDDEAFEEFLRLSHIKCRLLAGTHARDGALQAIVLTGPPTDLVGRLERLLACRRVAAQQLNGERYWHDANPTYLADDFIGWATTEGQSSQRILTAIQGLREAEGMLAGPLGPLMNEYFQAKAVLNGEATPDFKGKKDAVPSGVQWVAFLFHEFLSAEQQRAMKALDLAAAYEAAYLAEGVHALATPSSNYIWKQFRIDDAQLVASLRYQAQNRMGSYLDRLHQLSDARTSYLASGSFISEWLLPQNLHEWLAGVAWRRAERVRLALIAYRLDHDAYPDRLELLSPDYLADKELRDPYSNQYFGWAAGGFQLPIAEHYERWASDSALAPGTPLLWCGGMQLATPEEGLATHKEGGGLRFRNGAPDDEEVLVPAMYLREQTRGYDGGFWMAVPE
ncbi:ABC-2 family transporter protein [Botrimarina colliarenosi]|uniref:ABC-2 family transporter protein n=1 Tax=Botrimarina colliarenosi TaxID=2528001 RepID=A0A5C6ABU8_9BACT|nr:hypothetical protein [Botrimarina colliarenosi]TWT96857.1 ABC-2 family transporter protein [Botrimarina colliarenosi]